MHNEIITKAKPHEPSPILKKAKSENRNKCVEMKDIKSHTQTKYNIQTIKEEANDSIVTIEEEKVIKNQINHKHKHKHIHENHNEDGISCGSDLCNSDCCNHLEKPVVLEKRLSDKTPTPRKSQRVSQTCIY